jgi:hypothetical protein
MNTFYTIRVAQASLPRLTIAQRVVDKMVRNALVYDTETGESLFGFAVKSTGRTEPDLYVIDTIAPDESAIRRGAYFEQGDSMQSDIGRWWDSNWNQLRRLRRSSYGSAIGAKWDVPIIHMGDWHKHPGTLIEPSWGDTDTARDRIFDDDDKIPKQILALLVTVWEEDRDRMFAESETPNSVNGLPYAIRIPVENNLVVRVDSWYMSRATRRFVRVCPVIVPDKTLPSLPELSWDITQPDRCNHEVKLLEDEGYDLSFEVHDADDVPPMELCFRVWRYNSKQILIIITQADYPATMPTVRTAPWSAVKNLPEDADIFLAVWKASEPLPKDAYPTWTWNSDHTLLDLVRDVEATLAERSAVK